MAKGNSPKMTKAQRQTRLYRIVFVIFSVIILLTMILSLMR
jgi:hypothetical protein